MRNSMNTHTKQEWWESTFKINPSHFYFFPFLFFSTNTCFSLTNLLHAIIFFVSPKTNVYSYGCQLPLMVTRPSVCVIGDQHVYGSQETTKAALSFRAIPKFCPLKTFITHTYLLLREVPSTVAFWYNTGPFSHVDITFPILFKPSKKPGE